MKFYKSLNCKLEDINLLPRFNSLCTYEYTPVRFYSRQLYEAFHFYTYSIHVLACRVQQISCNIVRGVHPWAIKFKIWICRGPKKHLTALLQRSRERKRVRSKAERARFCIPSRKWAKIRTKNCILAHEYTSFTNKLPINYESNDRCKLRASKYHHLLGKEWKEWKWAPREKRVVVYYELGKTDIPFSPPSSFRTGDDERAWDGSKRRDGGRCSKQLGRMAQGYYADAKG